MPLLLVRATVPDPPPTIGERSQCRLSSAKVATTARATRATAGGEAGTRPSARLPHRGYRALPPPPRPAAAPRLTGRRNSPDGRRTRLPVRLRAGQRCLPRAPAPPSGVLVQPYALRPRA